MSGMIDRMGVMVIRTDRSDRTTRADGTDRTDKSKMTGQDRQILHLNLNFQVVCVL